MNREKESIRTLEPYVTNPTVCSVKLDANEGDKDLYLDLLKKLGLYALVGVFITLFTTL